MVFLLFLSFGNLSTNYSLIIIKKQLLTGLTRMKNFQTLLLTLMVSHLMVQHYIQLLEEIQKTGQPESDIMVFLQNLDLILGL